ncbi:hypothetical protein DsansV1_C03g0028921 [Dioscorea sansibarensis]
MILADACILLSDGVTEILFPVMVFDAVFDVAIVFVTISGNWMPMILFSYQAILTINHLQL